MTTAIRYSVLIILFAFAAPGFSQEENSAEESGLEYRLLGPPWESPDAYFRMSYPFSHANRIETPSLFMCGELDFNVPAINSEQMYQALRSLGVPTQLVIYPGQYHSLSKPSYIQDRLERTIKWYEEYLGGGQE
jgi:dipeptidyl aminopeptidase/acylaminoacyl peptidase